MLEEVIEEFLSDKGPSALVLRETLQPVEGQNAPFCAPTFAPPKERREEKSESLVLGKKEEMWGGVLRNAVIVDTVESQANRMERILKEKYPELVPQVILKIKRKKEVEPIKINLLDLGHRIADALIRFSSDLKGKIDEVLREFSEGNHLPLALISPTSLIFGFWDSRESGVKWPRLLRSEIWAYNVLQLSRKGTYKPAIMEKFKPEEEWKIYTELLETGDLGKELQSMSEEEKSRVLSSIGLSSCPWPEMTNIFKLADDGKIERIASLHLVGLRSLTARDNDRKTNLLRKYILGLSLVLMTYPQDYNLRQGCLLTRKENPIFEKVYPDRKPQPLNIEHDEALKLTRKVIEELNKEGLSLEKLEVNVDFPKERVKKEIEQARKKGGKEEEK